MSTCRFRRRAAVVLGSSMLLGLAGPASAQLVTDKPIRLILGVPPGSSTDVVARVFAEGLARQLGSAVIIDNRPGAAGTIATGAFLAAPRDGQTWLLAVNGFFSEVPHTIKPKFDPLADVKPLVEIGGGGLVLVGAAGMPPKNLPELVAWIKARPGKVNYASYSAGTLSHVLGLQLSKAAGLDMLHVGYKGSPPALQDLLGDQVQLMFDAPPSSLPYLAAGKLRAFAVSSPHRMQILPEVPTLDELGYKALTRTAWLALWTTPDMPRDLQVRMRQASLAALEVPALRKRMAELGVELPSGVPATSEQLSRQLATDHAAMGETLRSIGYKPE